MRAPPLYAPHIKAELEGRPSASLNRVAGLVPPGRYTVKLVVSGQTLSAPLEVRKDPNTTGTEADIKAQAEYWGQLKTELDGVADMVNTIESVRAQLATLKAVNQSVKELGPAADSLEQKFIAVEERLTQLRITGRGQDLIRYPAKIGEQMGYLVNDVNATDNAPTAAQREVGAVLIERAAAAKAELERVVNRDLPAFNQLLRDKGLQGVVARPEPAKTS
jgi:hypothetical protein